MTTPLFIGNPTNKDYIFDGHAGAGPSASERWLTCTASLAASRAFLETLSPNQQVQFAKANLAARQGTTAHAVAEAECRFLLGLIDEAELEALILEQTIMPETEGEAYDEEMAEYVTEYTDLIKQYHDSGRPVLLEHRVSAVVPLMTVDANGDRELYEVNGSGDSIVLPSEEENVLTVVDLKYGEGVDVEVEDNSQEKIYALGALSELADPETGELPDLDHIEYVIVQPRLGGIKVWTESVEDLLAWRDEVLSPALTEALGGTKAGAAFRPSETACQWCPARGTCAALAESRVEAAVELFDTVVEAEFEGGPGAFPETGELTDERLAALYTQITGLTQIASDLKDELQRRLHRGKQVPGYTLVNYQPSRYWAEGAAEELMEDESMWTEPKLMSPTQAVKTKALSMPGKTQKERAEAAEVELAALIVKPDPRPVVAKEGDRRKPWGGPPPEQMFDIEEDA